MKPWQFIFLTCILLLAIMVGNYITTAPVVLTAVVASCIIALITFQVPENGLLFLIFSMMLSPEIALSSVAGRAVTLRVDDLLLVAVFLGWFANVSVSRDWRGFVKTPLDIPLLLLLSLYIISTALGILVGDIVPLKGFFYCLKYIEYFVLFWLVANVVSSREILRHYLIAGLITAVVVTLFAYSQFPTKPRVFAPFDYGGGEPASLGGYYLVVYAVVISLFLHAESGRARVLCLFLALFMLPPFIKTLSRASYLAFVPLLFTMLFFTRKRKGILALILIAGIIAFPLLFRNLYTQMLDRINTTFDGTPKKVSLALTNNTSITDMSAIERIESWKYILHRRFSKDLRTVVFGNGITGVGFIEGQFFLILGELGLLGVLLFYGTLIIMGRQSYRVYRSAANTIPRSLSLALLCSIMALVFQSFTTNTFIIVRIMEPFWFLAGLVMISPNIYATKTAQIAA